MHKNKPMPTMKQPTIKSLQANIKVLKEQAKNNETHIGRLQAIIKEKDVEFNALNAHKDSLWEKCKIQHTELNLLHTNITQYRETSVKLSDQLNSIKSKWWYKIFVSGHVNNFK
jgi:chromosome segregation ATPase